MLVALFPIALLASVSGKALAQEVPATLPAGQNLELVWDRSGFYATEVLPVVEGDRLVAYVAAADQGLLKFDLSKLDEAPAQIGLYASPTGHQADRLVSLGEGVAALSWQNAYGVFGDGGGGFELVRRDPFLGVLMPYGPPVVSAGGCHDITVFEANLDGTTEQVLACMAQAADIDRKEDGAGDAESNPVVSNNDRAVDLWVITDPARPFHATRWTDNKRVSPDDEQAAGCETDYVKQQSRQQQAQGLPAIRCFEVFESPIFRPHWLIPLSGNRIIESGYRHVAILTAPDLAKKPTLELFEDVTDRFDHFHAHDSHLRGGTLAISDEVDSGKVSILAYTDEGLSSVGKFFPPGVQVSGFQPHYNGPAHYGEFVPKRDIVGAPTQLNSKWFVSSWTDFGITIADFSSPPIDDDGIAEANRPAPLDAECCEQITTWGNTVAWALTGGVAGNVAPIVVDERLYILVADTARGLLLYRYCPGC